MPIGGTPLSPLSAPSLVAREEELALLVRAALAPPSITIVEGVAGIGKSRLLRELLRHPDLDGVTTLVGGCQEVPEPMPLAPVIDSLAASGVLGAPGHPPAALLQPLSAVGADQETAHAAGGSVDSRMSRQLLFHAVARHLAGHGRVVWVLEDLQWCDPTTAELLRFLTLHLPANVALVATHRREDLQSSPLLLDLAAPRNPDIAVQRLRLEPLGPAAVRHLVAALLAADEVSDEFATELHERTSGIPFAVEETLRLLQDRQGLVRRNGRWRRQSLERLEVPPTIRGMVLGRLSQLSRDARGIAEAAAVAGVPAEEDLLYSIAGLPRSRGLPGLREAVGASILFELEAGRYGFRHYLAQQATYEGLLSTERCGLHLRAARVLANARSRPLAQLARHLRGAERWRQWADVEEEAAAAAGSRGDHPGVVASLLDVVGSPHLSPAVRGRLALRLGWASWFGDTLTGETAEVLARVLADADLPAAVRGEIRYYRGALLTGLGDARRGFDELRCSVDELRRRPRLAARAMTLLASPWLVEGTLDEHLAWLERAAATAGRAVDPLLSLDILIKRTVVLLTVGDPTWHRLINTLPWRSAAVAEREQMLWGAYHLAGAHLHLGDYRRARECLDQVRRRADVLGHQAILGAPLEAAMILLLRATGEWAGLAERAMRHLQVTDDVTMYAVPARLTMGELALTRGALDEADRCFRVSLEAAGPAGLVPGVAAAAAGLGEVRLARGDAAGAVEETAAAVGVIARKGIWVWGQRLIPVAVEALVRCDRLDEATELTGSFAAGLEGRDAPLACASLVLCRGLLALARSEARTAAALFGSAAEQLADLPCPFEAAAARARAGATLLRAGDAAGTRQLQEALVVFESLLRDRDEAARLLRRFAPDVWRPRRGGRRSYGNVLTPQERTVAELAASGQTNAEIGRALFLSPRTVEGHVCHAMRKLGLRSRTALAHHWLSQERSGQGAESASAARGQ